MKHAATLLLSLMATSLFAATYPPHYRWQTLTTEHFLVHFHQGEEDLAQRAAAIAESAHARLIPLLGWEPQDRTHLILTDHVDLANGSATPFPNNRIEIYVSAPGADPSSPIEYYDNWLNLVITHEYAHILHLDQARGFSGAMRRIFGRNLFLGFPNEWSPLWLIEGLATLVESEATDAGRLKGTFVDMVLRTAAIEERFASEAQASGLSPFWPSGNARYFYGAKFLDWLVQKHGRENLTRFINEYSTNVVPFRVNATAEDVYGAEIADLWEEWSEEQQKIYRAEHERLQGEGLTPRERLTDLGYQTKHAVLSPDGRRIAYVHAGPFERPTIRIFDITTGRDVETHRVNTTSALAWSADGKSIAYADIEFVGSFALLSDLYMWEVGGDTRRLTRGARLKDPAFMPDGQTLIAVENRAGRNRLVEVDVASAAVRPLVAPADYTQFSEPVVSHDGTRIAVAEWRNGQIDVVVYDRSGRRLANLTESFTRATNASPRFSRDDGTIWFTSDVTGIPNVYAIPASGGDARRLTNLYGGAFYPSSADGRRFYYVDYSANGFDLAMFDAGREHTISRMERRLQPAEHRPAERDGAPLQNVERYSPWQSLRPRWWFPIISSTGDEDDPELVVGVTTSGGDVLGHHSYAATITNQSHSIIYTYDKLFPTFTVAALRYDDLVGDFTERTNRLFAEVSVPLRKAQWQTVAALAVLRDDIGGDVPERFRGELHGVRATALFDSAREYGFSISPERGVTSLVQYEVLRGDASLQQLRADARGYLSIPWSRSPAGRHVLALRVAGGRNTGDFVQQRELKLGGVESGALNTLDTTHFPVRGYNSDTLRGQRAAIASIEYRFPIYEIDDGPTTWPIFLHRIHADVFADAGRVWQQRFSQNDTLASVGTEAALDFNFGYFIPLRGRIGVALRLRDPDKGEVQPYIAFGSAF